MSDKHVQRAKIIEKVRALLTMTSRTAAPRLRP
jgi:hypothetical protein